MLNNYFHDLAVAVLFCSVLASWFIWRGLSRDDTSPDASFFRHRIWRGLSRFIWGSLAWIAGGGIIRALAYQDYEWLPAAGRSQIPALVIKHILLVSMVAISLYLFLKVKRSISRSGGIKTNPDP